MRPGPVCAKVAVAEQHRVTNNARTRVHLIEILLARAVARAP
jgi:hypothetical protein